MPAIVTLLPAAAMWIILLVGGREISAGRMEIPEFFTFAMYVYELTFPDLPDGLRRGGRAAGRGVDATDRRAALRAARRSRIAPMPSRSPSCAARSSSAGSPSATRARAARRRSATSICACPRARPSGWWAPWAPARARSPALIPRLFEVEDGQLFVDGIDINRIPLRTLRESIAMVPQDSFLFSMTLAENIAFGLAGCDAEQIAVAARRAQLAKDVPDLPDGCDTLVGERGVMLSGGQRQRTALARALAAATEDPDPRRHALERRRRDRGGDPARAGGGLRGAHGGRGLSPREQRAQGGPDRRARGGAHRRARQPRRAGRAGRGSTRASRCEQALEEDLAAEPARAEVRA